MIKFRLTEHTDILPGVRKRAGTVVSGLPKDRTIKLVSEGKIEPVDYAGLPEGFPRRDLLVAHEYFSVEQVEAASDSQLTAINGIGRKTLQEIRKFNPNTTDKED